MSQNTKKPYDLPDWPAEAEQTQEAPRPRRKRRAPAEPEDLWGKLRFRAGKKVRWFGRRCRRVVREAPAHRFPESNRGALQALLMLWGLLPAAASRLRERLLGKRKERIHRSGKFGTSLIFENFQKFMSRQETSKPAAAPFISNFSAENPRRGVDISPVPARVSGCAGCECGQSIHAIMHRSSGVFHMGLCRSSC